MATPHDAIFKAVFAAPNDAADLIRPLLPAPLAAAIDWSSLVLVPGSFIDDALRQTHADLLFEVRIRGRRALLYLLAEHKSRGDRFTSLQLLGRKARKLSRDPRILEARCPALRSRAWRPQRYCPSRPSMTARA